MKSHIPGTLHQVSGDVVFDISSPQYQASQWLMRLDEHDEYELDPNTQHIRLLQRYALVALDFAFHQNDESRLGWSDPNLHECEWDGVTCAYFDGVPRVRTINWARRKLSGRALPEFHLLPALETLDLAQNEIEGDLEPFSTLKFLKNLYLFENKIGGTLDQIGGNLSLLERLYLGQNQLSGTLSSNLWQPNRDRPLRK
jgi:Leucine-rich repeat (LRR) protein